MAGVEGKTEKGGWRGIEDVEDYLTGGVVPST
jgi:hypothetical protein